MHELITIKKRLLSFAEYAKDAQPDELVTLINTIVERIYVTTEEDKRICQIFIKDCATEDYTEIFGAADYIAHNTVQPVTIDTCLSVLFEQLYCNTGRPYSLSFFLFVTHDCNTGKEKGVICTRGLQNVEKCGIINYQVNEMCDFEQRVGHKRCAIQYDEKIAGFCNRIVTICWPGKGAYHARFWCDL